MFIGAAKTSQDPRDQEMGKSLQVQSLKMHLLGHLMDKVIDHKPKF